MRTSFHWTEVGVLAEGYEVEGWGTSGFDEVLVYLTSTRMR